MDDWHEPDRYVLGYDTDTEAMEQNDLDVGFLATKDGLAAYERSDGASDLHGVGSASRPVAPDRDRRKRAPRSVPCPNAVRPPAPTPLPPPAHPPARPPARPPRPFEQQRGSIISYGRQYPQPIAHYRAFLH